MGETLGATFDVGNMVTQTRKREGKSSKIIPLQLSKRQGNLHAKYKFGALKKTRRRSERRHGLLAEPDTSVTSEVERKILRKKRKHDLNQEKKKVTKISIKKKSKLRDLTFFRL